jgi:hypothetical protein
MATVVGEWDACLARPVRLSFFSELLPTRTSLQMFGSPESNGNTLLLSTSASKRSGGFACCIPVVLPPINVIPSFLCIIPNGKSVK